MANEKNGDELAQAEALVKTFHRVGSLKPPGQKLVSICKDTTVAEALQIMEERHFSQLPIEAGKKVLGVFSYRSFSQIAAQRQRKERNEVLADLPVEEFMEQFPFVGANEDWTQIQDHLDKSDGMFVGVRNNPDGLVTTMDVYQYFRNIADPFILVAEIEVSLRGILAIRLPKAKDTRQQIFNHCLSAAYGSNPVPQHLSDLSLENYITLVTAEGNWKYFKDILGEGERARSRAVKKLGGVAGLRNDAFHFRRKLRDHEVKKLEECRRWLYNAIDAYEGLSNGRVESKAAETLPPPHPVFEHLAPKLTPAAHGFYGWLVEEVGRRAAYFDTKKNDSSFSVRWRANGHQTSFAFTYAPDKLSIYFGDLKKKLPADALAGLRRDLIRYGVFVESGLHSLNALVSQVDENQLRDACCYMFDWLVGQTTMLEGDGKDG